MTEPSKPASRCGTYAEYQQHRKRGEVPCEACRLAQHEYAEQYRRSRGMQPREPLRPCGTRAAYLRHKEHGEEPCQPCVTAYREAHRLEEEQHRRRQGAKPRPSLQPCETEAGYRRHLKAGEEPCPGCREAVCRNGRERYVPSDRVLQPCGTYSAYRRHVSAGELPCEACNEAHRAYARSRYVSTEKNPARKGRKQGDPLRPCGTYAAYIRHIRHAEIPCDLCCQSARDYQAAGRKPRIVRSCGTYAAYGRHLRKGEIPCGPCREASRAYRVGRYRLTLQSAVQAPCGTWTAYRRHVRNDEAPCDECQAAWRRTYGRPRAKRTGNQPCGTYAAYIRHIRAREDPCRPCQRAHLAYGARRRALELGATIAPLPPDFMDLLVARYGSQCGPVWQPGAGCGKPILAGKETLDHVIPLTKGGLHCMENFQLMHRSCNTRKGAKVPPSEVTVKILAAVAEAGYL
jgi:hypothetical protein